MLNPVMLAIMWKRADVVKFLIDGNYIVNHNVALMNQTYINETHKSK